MIAFAFERIRSRTVRNCSLSLKSTYGARTLEKRNFSASFSLGRPPSPRLSLVVPKHWQPSAVVLPRQPNSSNCLPPLCGPVKSVTYLIR